MGRNVGRVGDTAAADNIALFTYPTTGYFDAFTYAALASAGGSDFFNKCMTYEDGIWESEDATKVFELVAKLATYTEGTTVANANNDNFTKNQQLILDNKPFLSEWYMASRRNGRSSESRRL